jgi:hypothetical protein
VLQEARRGSRDVTLLILKLRGIMGMGGQIWAPVALSPEQRSNTHCTGGSGGPRASLADIEMRKYLVPIGIRTPKLPARSQSPYRLRSLEQ